MSDHQGLLPDSTLFNLTAEDAHPDFALGF